MLEPKSPGSLRSLARFHYVCACSLRYVRVVLILWGDQFIWYPSQTKALTKSKNKNNVMRCVQNGAHELELLGLLEPVPDLASDFFTLLLPKSSEVWFVKEKFLGPPSLAALRGVAARFTSDGGLYS